MLHRATEPLQLLAVASAIQSSQRLVNVQDVEGFSALHLAAMAGHTGYVPRALTATNGAGW